MASNAEWVPVLQAALDRIRSHPNYSNGSFIGSLNQLFQEGPQKTTWIYLKDTGWVSHGPEWAQGAYHQWVIKDGCPTAEELQSARDAKNKKYSKKSDTKVVEVEGHYHEDRDDLPDGYQDLPERVADLEEALRLATERWG